MGFSDDTPRRRRREIGVAVAIDRHRILTVAAAILALTLMLVALTMFGPGRPTGDVRADTAEYDAFVQGSAVSAPVCVSTVVWLRNVPPTWSAPLSRAGARAHLHGTAESFKRTTPR